MYYLILILWGITLNVIAQSAAPAPDKALETLQSKSMSQESLQSYEQLATHKMKDVLDYINIIRNKNYDKSMREAAVIAVQQHCDKDAEVKCQWILSNKSKSQKCNLKDLLKKLLNNPSTQTIHYSDIELYKGLQSQGENIWKGQLCYHQSSPSSKQSRKIFFHFELIRIVKQFGSQKEELWEVRLVGN